MERFRQLLNGILLLGVIALLFSSCYYDNAEDLYPSTGGGCDTVNVSYATNIAPVMQAQCTSCHSGGSASGGVDLSTYALQSANAGRIYARMADASNPMPPSGLLDACTVNKVKSWFDHGAPNN